MWRHFKCSVDTLIASTAKLTEFTHRSGAAVGTDAVVAADGVDALAAEQARFRHLPTLITVWNRGQNSWITFLMVIFY